MLHAILRLMVTAPVLNRQSGRVGTDVVVCNANHPKAIFDGSGKVQEAFEISLYSRHSGNVSLIFHRPGLDEKSAADMPEEQGDQSLVNQLLTDRLPPGLLSTDDSSGGARFTAVREFSEVNWILASSVSRRELYRPVYYQVGRLLGILVIGNYLATSGYPLCFYVRLYGKRSGPSGSPGSGDRPVAQTFYYPGAVQKIE